MDMDPPPNPVWFPTWQIKLRDGSEAQRAWQQVEAVYRKHLPRIILAPSAQFETLWQDYVAALKDAGVSVYEAYMQEEINNRIQLWTPKY